MKTKPDSTNASVAAIQRLLRKTQARPGGGRLDFFSQGYDKATDDFRKLLREELKKLRSDEGRNEDCPSATCSLPVCDDCNIPMDNRFTDPNTGKDGYGCPKCGWSVDEGEF